MTVAPRPSQPEAKTSSGQVVDTAPKAPSLAPAAATSVPVRPRLQHQQGTLIKAKVSTAS